jgi:LysM repeat protein/type II secretory pathway component GspD/PulD (secretin)
MIFRRKTDPVTKVWLGIIWGVILLSLASYCFAFDDSALDNSLEYVNVDLRDIFRDLAAAGRFKVLFAHPFQEKVTAVIDSGALIKETISQLAANHGLTVKWLNLTTAVIGNDDSLPKIDTADIALQVFRLKSIPSISIVKTLETVIPSYRIQYDLKANQVAVMVNSLELQNIAAIINRWDRDVPSLRMEIKAVEVTPDFLQANGLAGLIASNAMKAYPLTQNQSALMEGNPGVNLLARQEVTSLNNQETRLFFGDQIPKLIEAKKDDAVEYQVRYIGVGTTLDYLTRIGHDAEFTIQLQARVNVIGNPPPAEAKPAPDAPLRQITTTVGLTPGQTLILTGVLDRSEYLRMKTPLYQFPFLSSLFNNGIPLPGGSSVPAAPAPTVILMTPSFNEKAANPPGPESTTIDIAYTVKKRDTLNLISQKFGVDSQTLIRINRLKNPKMLTAKSTLIIPVPNERVYTVKPKETLWRLAKRYGTTLPVLKDLNSLEDVTRIEAGQKLVLPVPASKIINPRF